MCKQTRKKGQPGFRRRGAMLIYCTMAMLAVLGICSLAVDWGRVQLAKTELQRAVDAAARAATLYLPSDTTSARSTAISVGAANKVDGDGLILQSGDVVFGKWDSTTKTLNTASSTPDAVRITGYRTTARGNAIPLSFARIVGLTSTSVTVTATAQTSGGTASYGIVGLNSFNMNSATCFTGSYNSTTHAFTTGTASNDGSIASNSNMNLNSTASVGGTIYYYTASAPNGAKDYDAKTKMTTAIATPATPTAGSYVASNDNASVGLPTSGANFNLSSGTYSIAGGHYVLNSFAMSGGTVTFTGATTIYMYGNFGFTGGTINTHQNKPDNLKIVMCASAGLTLSASSNFYAEINAPASPLNMNGPGNLIGSVMATSISMSGTAGIYYDSVIGTNGATSSGGTTSVVK